MASKRGSGIILIMKTEDFDYELPEELIAQTPLEDRAASRLLVLDRETGAYEDKSFADILDYLRPGDALVLNETKVLPARIYGYRAETGGKIEVLLLKDLGQDNTWECLTRPQKRLKLHDMINFYEGDFNSGEPILSAEVKEILPEGVTRLKFTFKGRFLEILDRIGSMPLPPYIHEKLADKDRYQTVYAQNPGSAAAPTAGLHFTPELLAATEKKGVKIVKITLHVGLGTFRPVQVDDVSKHKMHEEEYGMSLEAAETLNSVKKAGGRIIAVGTTSVRTLETVASRCKRDFPEPFAKDSGNTSIFIYPGYKFLAVDGLITNFHLPKSTLLMLVSAFSSRENILKAYRHAVAEKYRFFSFGDAMLII